MTSATKTQKELLAENEGLRLRLEEAEETLRAIGSGEVDAFVVSSPEGQQQVFTLKGADLPYRILVESMNEGAATLAADGTILYCNKRLSAMLKTRLESLIGTKLGTYVEQKYYLTYTALLENCTQESQSEEIALTTVEGNSIPVFMSCCVNDISNTQGISLVVTDLTLQRRNEAILTSEKFTNSIIEQTSGAMFVCDAKGKIIRASLSAHKLCGMNPLLKQFNKIFRLRMKESGEKFSLLHHMRRGVNAGIEVEFKRNDGRLCTLLLNATTHKNIQNIDIGSIVTLTDITERTLIEEALHKSEFRLQAAYGHLQRVNQELQIASEELRAQGEELQNYNQELKELWERSKASEEALRGSEERHRVLAETMLQGVVHQDASGTIISMNPAAERILGKNREDFLGNSSVDVEHDTIDENGKIFPGEKHPSMVALRTGMPVRGVIMGVFNPKLKEYRWIGIDAVPVFRPGDHLPSEVYSVFGDITDRKNAEIALLESEQRIQQALHVSRSFTFDWSSASDQVKRSASCAAILHLTSDEAVINTGEHFFQSVHPDDRARFGQILRDLTPTANTYLTEYRYMRNDGSEITLEETGQASFDAAGKMLRLVGVSTDISVRKQVEEALRKVHAELESRVEERTSDLTDAVKILEEEIHERQNAEKALYQETLERLKAVETLREKEQMLILQSRQAAMGEMIGNVAHQWRQPLNTLGLYTQQLGVFYGSLSFNKEFLDNSIAKSMGIIQHMSKTIDDFRNYFKPDKEKADFYVIDAIKSTLSLLEGNFDSPKIAIDFVVHDNPVINGYQNEFAQVFLNILNNARDAIIEREIADGRILITIYSEDSCAVVTVADNAGGMPDEVINKVFDPYFTTKGPQVGTGIGLFMAKTIIEKNMGGTLSVCNTDTGAEFRIEVEH